MILRAAIPADAAPMAAMLRALTMAGKRTRPSDEAFALGNYIAHEDLIRCTVAEEDDRLLGLQSLRRATPGNEFGVTPGWGIIGTHVHPDAARRGLGRSLFAETRAAARAAGIRLIDATIGAANAEGLAYYAAMGFRTYATEGGAIRKSFRVS